MAGFHWVPSICDTVGDIPSYLKSLKLDRHPFPVAPDDAHFYASDYIEQVVAEIIHSIDARKGFMVISGDVGLGKTTVTRRILQILEEKQVRTSLVFHTSLKDVDLLREINRDFGMVEPGASAERGTLGDELQRLNTFLTAEYQQGKNCTIIIDDAQNLDLSSLELVRMISNLEADCQKMVQILLVGQPELMTKFGLKELRQLRSRIFINKAVRPLSIDELRTYVVFKLSQAGNQGRITVTRKAYRYLYRYTRGNFRHVNMLMDRCLYVLCKEGGSSIDNRHVRAAWDDMQQKKKQSRWPMPVMATALGLSLVLIALAWAFHSYISPDAAATPTLSHQAVPSSSGQILDSHSGFEDPLFIKTGKEAVDPAVEAFLRSVHLEGFAVDFERARIHGHLTAWSEQIYHQVGLRLVQLPTLSEPVRRRYGALALPTADGRRVDWLLFWRPTLMVSKFYYGYHGQEIARLQQMLSSAGYYNQKIDGTVGPYLMKALIAFQTRSGLAVTGWPDAATLFSLCQQEGRSS